MTTSVPTGEPADEPPRKRPFQFGLRDLLGLPVVVAWFIGIPIWLDVPVVWIVMSPCLLFFLGLILGIFLASRRRVTWGAVITLGIAWLLGCLAIQGAVDPNWIWTRGACGSNLTQIGLALFHYHDVYGCFPPPYVADEDGRPMHSWRVLILPFMEHRRMYEQYRLDEPWDSAHNRRVTAVEVRSLHCPEDGDWSSQTTSYLAVVGPNTIWRPEKPVTLSQILDGTTNTLAVVEVGNSGIHWAEPRDLDFAQLALGVNSEEGAGVSSFHVDRNLFARPVGVNVLMADGSVRWLPNTIDPKQLQAMATIDGSEPVETD